MKRRKNFGFERRQRETLRRTKQEAKRQRIAERADSGEVGPEIAQAPETGAPPGQWEWFSPSRGRVLATETGQHPPDEAPNDWVLLTEKDEEDEEGGAEEAPGG
jgi:hypothetical protein